MNENFKLIKNFLIVSAPILASSVLGISPSKAATFAFSNSEVELTNFSQMPSNVSTALDGDTLTVSKGGMVEAISDADAEFFQAQPSANNSALSLAFGESQDYLGFAEVEAEVLGNFDLKANTNFSFDFTSFLSLMTSIDNPPIENARASGDISFLLLDIDNNTTLDFFNLTGNLVTEGDNDFITLQKSDSVTINQALANSDFGGKEESLIASVGGSVERFFTNETNLALIEIKRNRVRVTAPEPSINLALLISGSAIGLALKNRRRKRIG